MKRSVLTALVLPSVVAVMLGGTALSAPMASAAPVSSSTAAAVPDDGGAAADPTSAPVPDAAAPAAEAAPAPVESAPAEAPVEVPVEAEPAESGPVESAPIDAPAADDASAPAPAPAPGTDEVVGIAAATEPGTVTIAGTTEFGDLQTAVTDGWPDGTTFTYQWTRDGAAVEGATAETYVLVRADIGRVVEVAVTGTGPAAGDEPTTVVSERRVAAGVAPTFTAQPGTDLTVVAGEPYSFTWEASGDPAPSIEIVAAPSTLVATLPEGATVTQAPGSLTISGTSTASGFFSFGVTPLNMVGIGELLVVDLEVAPAAPAGILVTVGTTANVVGVDQQFARASSLDGSSSTLSLDDGAGADASAYVVDRFENPIPFEDYADGTERTTVTTNGPHDVIGVSPSGFPMVTFNGPGSRSMAVSLGGFTASIPVEVRSTAAVVPAASGTTPIATAGSLAYTGGEPADGLFALAAGLLAAGAALTVVRLRLRRRRVQH
ncbi:hypothetical protein EDF18_3176 [Frigoribacterium sp. PhB107]|uniref:hypothetical protein n=1 Tax=Frigoribacterium sp. PhB107 TaxID=2485172 RepID=UPI000F4865DC|nr:hypothetical protein [Frigoribacterium sp. PhB107]ROP72951.1 hypothetical protein EDF18_3176 [Frigoribacterium sp. PhB107]